MEFGLKLTFPPILLLLLLLLEKTNLSCPKQASRTGYKVNKAVQYTINRGINRLNVVSLIEQVISE